MRKRCMVWAAALVLLLALGVGAALPGPIPSEAEAAAAMFRVGMEEARARRILVERFGLGAADIPIPPGFQWQFEDGSSLIFGVEGWEETRLSSIQITPPVPPLTRLRRTLAHLIPALKE